MVLTVCGQCVGRGRQMRGRKGCVSATHVAWHGMPMGSGTVRETCTANPTMPGVAQPPRLSAARSSVRVTQQISCYCCIMKLRPSERPRRALRGWHARGNRVISRTTPADRFSTSSFDFILHTFRRLIDASVLAAREPPQNQRGFSRRGQVGGATTKVKRFWPSEFTQLRALADGTPGTTPCTAGGAAGRGAGRTST